MVVQRITSCSKKKKKMFLKKKREKEKRNLISKKKEKKNLSLQKSSPLELPLDLILYKRGT